jgi:signal transduction histidine kinase
VVRRIPIRAKVAGALAVPLVGLAAAAGIGVSTNATQARNVTRQAELATASIGHAGLISALQNERNQATLEMLGLVGGIALEVDDGATARQLTDTAATALHHQISGQSDRLRDDYAAALDTLAVLPDLRGRVDAALATAGPANREAAHEVFAEYTDMVATFFASHDRFSLVVDDAELRRGDDLVHYSSHATDAVAQLAERLLYLGSGPGGIDEPVEAAQIAELRRDVDKNNGVVRTKGTGAYAAAADELLVNPRVVGLPRLAGEAIDQGGQVDPAAVLATTPLGAEGGYLGFRDEVVDVLDAEAQRLSDAADMRRRWYLGSALAVVAAALLIAWWVSRSITRPLRDLSVKARAMATHRLPAAVQDILDAPPGEDLVVPEAEPIVVGARDEVSDVAGAFNDVQHSAVALAVEQAALRRNVAESYVNLGRRNQNLLSRLLDAVGDFERGETDPGRLSQLYRLDHLATRIRRNAESLLVLSQSDAPARWQPPVQMADVVRAALGEIENYERVLVRSLDPATVVGGASADLTHMLAELIENGLRHSPPRELVDVSGRVTPDGYSITVVDHGLGMTPDDIERANQRLAGSESFTVTPAKYLGHYVTAVLAARHGIKVRLQGSVVVGIAALVELPASLITDRRATPPPPPALPAAGGAERLVAADGGGVGETPSPDEVRNAVAFLRSRSSAPPPGRSSSATPSPPPPPPPPPTTPPPPPPPPPPPRPSTDAPSPRPVPRWATSITEHPRPDAPARATAGGGTALALPADGTPSSLAAPRVAGDGVPPAPREPERTASGLERRVPGAHVSVSVAAEQPLASPMPGRPAPPSADASVPPVDGAEIQRFLTSLVGGVQRSLDEQRPTTGVGDEG